MRNSAIAVLRSVTPSNPIRSAVLSMDSHINGAATQVSVKLSTQLPEPFKVPADALVTLVDIASNAPYDACMLHIRPV